VGQDYFHRREKEKVLTEFLSGTGRFADMQAESNYLDKLAYLCIRYKTSTEVSLPPVIVVTPKKGDPEVSLAPKFARLELAVQEDINDIGRLTDPVEQLLRYSNLLKTLNGTENTEGLYDKKKILKPVEGRTTRRQTHIKNGRTAWGVIGYFTGGISGGMAAIGLASLVGALGLILWPVAIVAGIVLGGIYGKTRGERKYRRIYTAEQKHATRMSEMEDGIQGAIGKLKGSLVQDEGIKILAQLPPSKFEELKTEFPAIAKEFNRRAAITSNATAFVVEQPARRSALKPAA
jgi:hypothetical protein